jgi:hypothetical protein
MYLGDTHMLRLMLFAVVVATISFLLFRVRRNISRGESSRIQTALATAAVETVTVNGVLTGDVSNGGGTLTGSVSGTGSGFITVFVSGSVAGSKPGFVSGEASGTITDGVGVLTAPVSGTGNGFVTAVVDFSGEPTTDN